MADPLAIVSSVAYILHATDRYLNNPVSHSYGPTAGFLISIGFRNTVVEYERLQRAVLPGSDEEILRFRDSVTNECNMTAVAVGLIF